MTESDPGRGSEPEVHKGRLSLIWLIPIVAVGLAIYLGIRTEAEKGPTITLYFATGEGLEAGKTKIRFKSVPVGVVDKISIRHEAPQIVVHCALDKTTEGHLLEGSQFWVVRPRVGFGGVSGLGTLVSGAFIAFKAGPEGGKSLREFTGLEAPPITEPDGPGLKIVLHAPELGSLGPGTPIYFRQIRVGTIEGHELGDDGVDVHALIDPDHAERVRTNTRFWNSGGLEVQAGFGKIDVRAESLEALITGGVAFDSPSGGKPAAAGARFLLHPSRGEVEAAPWLYGGLRVVVEGPQLGGLKRGDFVYYREERVGAVVSHALATNSRGVRVHLNIRSPYATLVRDNSVFWNASGISADMGLRGLHIHAESLEALMAGGIAFATPDKPGARVKPGSVFRLQPEIDEDWLKWRPLIWRGPAEKAPAAAAPKQEEEHGFFHHGDKSKEKAADDGPTPEENKKDGFFHRFRR
jgi:paraquat-inducible protein B